MCYGDDDWVDVVAWCRGWRSLSWFTLDAAAFACAAVVFLVLTLVAVAVIFSVGWYTTNQQKQHNKSNNNSILQQ